MSGSGCFGIMIKLVFEAGAEEKRVRKSLMNRAQNDLLLGLDSGGLAAALKGKGTEFRVAQKLQADLLKALEEHSLGKTLTTTIKNEEEERVRKAVFASAVHQLELGLDSGCLHAALNGKSKNGCDKAALDKVMQKLQADLFKAIQEHSLGMTLLTTNPNDRKILGDKMYKGEVVQRWGQCAWVKPEISIMAMPFEAEPKLVQMNKAIRENSKSALGQDHVVYLHVSDVAEKGLVLKPGAQIEFKLYSFDKGIGGCQIKSA